MKDFLIPLGLIAAVLTILALLVRPDRQAPSRPVPVAGKPPRVLEHPVEIDSADVDAEPITRIFYLVDVSKSFHSGAQDSPFRRSVPLIRRAITKLTRFLPSPQRHLIGTIGEESLRQTPRCEIRVLRKKLFARDSGMSGSAITQCEARLISLPPERDTDIRGAVKYAALALETQRSYPKGLVMFTDLQEDIPVSQEAGVPDLTSVCVAVYIEITGDAVRVPSQFDDRVRQWKSLLQSWKARGWLFKHMAGFDPTELGEFLRTCTTQ